MKVCSTNRCYLLAVLLLMAGNAFAVTSGNHVARFKVNPLHLESGVSRDWVQTARRDAAGYLWVGTDNGLRRYDGYQHAIFTSNPDDPHSLGSTLVYSLLIDSE